MTDLFSEFIGIRNANAYDIGGSRRKEYPCRFAYRCARCDEVIGKNYVLSLHRIGVFDTEQPLDVLDSFVNVEILLRFAVFESFDDGTMRKRHSFGNCGCEKLCLIVPVACYRFLAARNMNYQRVIFGIPTRIAKDGKMARNNCCKIGKSESVGNMFESSDDAIECGFLIRGVVKRVLYQHVKTCIAHYWGYTKAISRVSSAIGTEQQMRTLQIVLTFGAKQTFAFCFHFTARDTLFARNQRSKPKLGARYGVHFHLDATSQSLRESPV